MRRAKTQLFSRRQHQQSQLHQHPSTHLLNHSSSPLDDHRHPPPHDADHDRDHTPLHTQAQSQHPTSPGVFDGSRSRLALSMGFKGFLSGSMSRKSAHNNQANAHANNHQQFHHSLTNLNPSSMSPPPPPHMMHASSNTVAGGGIPPDPHHHHEHELQDHGHSIGATAATKERSKGVHSSSQIAVDFFKWGKKRRQVFGTRASLPHGHNQDDPHGVITGNIIPGLANSLVSTDAPPLRYSNSNLCIAGWLSKRGKRLGSRIDRFFQLNGSILSNSRNESARPTWFVNVRGSKVLSGPGRQIIFNVNKSFTTFFAPTDELHERWMRALQAVCGNVTDFYDFGKLIGRGAYSEVFIARDKQRNELCAVKVLERSNDEHAKLIDRELAVLRMLNHANIVQIYDIFDSTRETYVVMEYLAGGELLDLITESDHLSERNSKQVIREVLQAIQYLHVRGIVHRDVKPENILCVNRAWPLRVKLTDFGLSKMVGAPTADGVEHVMRSQCGTAYYLAPEIANNEAYSKPVDLWACGVVLYVMLAGKFPFYGDTDEKFMRRLRAGVKFPDKEWTAISSDAKALVRGLLDPKPDSRLTAAQALQHRWLMEDSEVDVTSSSVPSLTAQRSHHRQRVQYDAITEPLSLQLAEFTNGRSSVTSAERCTFLEP